MTIMKRCREVSEWKDTVNYMGQKELFFYYWLWQGAAKDTNIFEILEVFIN
jgi:hypothetical protein